MSKCRQHLQKPYKEAEVKIRELNSTLDGVWWPHPRYGTFTPHRVENWVVPGALNFTCEAGRALSHPESKIPQLLCLFVRLFS